MYKKLCEFIRSKKTEEEEEEAYVDQSTEEF
jgi:hypothetical protein